MSIEQRRRPVPNNGDNNRSPDDLDTSNIHLPPDKFKNLEFHVPRESTKAVSIYVKTESDRFVKKAKKQLELANVLGECYILEDMDKESNPLSSFESEVETAGNINTQNSRDQSLADSHSPSKSYSSLKTLQKAQKYYEQALHLYPDNIKALANFGKFLECTDRIEEADLMFYRALTLSPNHQNLKIYRDSSYKKLSDMQIARFDHLDELVGILQTSYRSGDQPVPAHSTGRVTSTDLDEIEPDSSTIGQAPNVRSSTSYFSEKLVCREMFFLQIYHTVAIEGSTFNLNQVKTVLKTGRTPIPLEPSSDPIEETDTRSASKTFSIREINEIVGAADAFQYANWTVFRHSETQIYQKILFEADSANDLGHGPGQSDNSEQKKIQPRLLNLSLVKDLHSRLMVRVDPSIAGRYRHGSMYVSGYKAPEPQQLDRLMAEFGYWLETMEEKVFNSAAAQADREHQQQGTTAGTAEEPLTFIHPLRFAAEAHYRLVKIHPFQDGNGRLSRLLMNIILMRAGYPPTLIKIEDRQEYFESLDYDSSFLSFIIKATAETVETYLDGFGIDKSTCKRAGQAGKAILPRFNVEAILLGQSDSHRTEPNAEIVNKDHHGEGSGAHYETDEIDADGSSDDPPFGKEEHFLIVVKDRDEL